MHILSGFHFWIHTVYRRGIATHAYKNLVICKKKIPKTKGILFPVFTWLIQNFYLVKLQEENILQQFTLAFFRYSPASPGTSRHSGSLFMFNSYIWCSMRRSLLSRCSPIHNLTEMFYDKDTFLPSCTSIKCGCHQKSRWLSCTNGCLFKWNKYIYIEMHQPDVILFEIQ